MEYTCWHFIVFCDFLSWCVGVEILKVKYLDRVSEGDQYSIPKCLCLAYFSFWKGNNEFQGELTELTKIKFYCEAENTLQRYSRRNVIPESLSETQNDIIR